LNQSKPRVAVLGAGPAGISAAWRLSELGYPVTVIERDEAVGGMGKTITVGRYAVDYGPHTFHVRETDESREVLAAIRKFFGEDPLILTRGTRVLLQGREYIYPLEMLQVLTGVNPLLSLRIVWDYVLATVRTALAPPRKEDSFEEWGVRNLGRTLYDLCFGIYSARVWGLPTSQISSKQAQRVAKLNLKNIILRTLGIKADPATYFTKYMYPRLGISELFEGMAREVSSAGNQVLLGAPAIRVERDHGRASRVVYAQHGEERAVECDVLLSTLPLPALVNMMAPALPDDVVAHAARLRYRSLKLIYIALARPRMTDYHWVYLLDEHFRVNRLSEQKNVSPYMVPEDSTVLCIELSLWRDEALWTASDEEIYRLALRDLMKMGYDVTENEVLEYHVTDIPTAYPVYELNFEDHLIPVLDGVHEVPNLLTLGRHGLFLNNSMDDNVLLGMKIADHLEARGTDDSQAWKTDMLAFMNLRFQGK
jgi:protoporphyrinogen oxidase